MVLAHECPGPEITRWEQEAPSFNSLPQSMWEGEQFVFCVETRPGGGSRHADVCAQDCPPGDRPKPPDPGLLHRQAGACGDVVGCLSQLLVLSCPLPHCLLEPSGPLTCCDSLHLACLPRSAWCGASERPYPLPVSAEPGATSCLLPPRTATAVAPGLLGGVELLLPAWTVTGGRAASWTLLADVGQSHAPAADSKLGSLMRVSWVIAVPLGWPDTAFPGEGNQARPPAFSVLLLPTLFCQSRMDLGEHFDPNAL